MALHGVNLALSYTGQEEVYRKVVLWIGSWLSEKVADQTFLSYSPPPGLHQAWPH